MVIHESDATATWVITLLVPHRSPLARIDAPGPAASAGKG